MNAEPMVTVSRQWNDWRRIAVPVWALSGFHINQWSGGVGAQAPYAGVYAYMSCADIPAGEEFAHSCQHGVGPHRIRVYVSRKYNPPGLYRRLRQAAETGTQA